MRRRWLVVVVVALALVGGAVWWAFCDGLTAEKRRLVGTWRWAGGDGGTGTWAFQRDRTASQELRWEPGGLLQTVVWPPARWSVSGGAIVIDAERNPARRVLRRFLRLVGSGAAPEVRCPVTWVGPDEIEIVEPRSTRRWTRAPAD